MSDNNDWLQTLQPGDNVFVHGFTFRNEKRVCTVERTTATQILLVGMAHTRYRKRDGWEQGTGYHRSRLIQWTAEAEAAWREHEGVEQLRRETYTVLSQRITWNALESLTRAQCEHLLAELATLGLYTPPTS